MSISYKLGQIGGFPLRLSWLPRLVILANTKDGYERGVFARPEDLAIDMGIGINMVKALRIWAMSTGIVDDKGRITQRANDLFCPLNGYDKYAEKEDTLWLLHWLICSNTRCFTAAGWLLNFYHARSFSAAEALNAFYSHIESQGGRAYSKGTIRMDVETSLRMYAAQENRRNKDIQDDYHFRTMRLFSARPVSNEIRYARILRSERPRINSAVILYAIIHSMVIHKVSNCTFSNLYAGDKSYLPAPGVVFGYNKDGFFSVLEKIATEYSNLISLQMMSDGECNIRLLGNVGKGAIKGDQLAADNFYFAKEEAK